METSNPLFLFFKLYAVRKCDHRYNFKSFNWVPIYKQVGSKFIQFIKDKTSRVSMMCI